jgi:hypothetical protein
MKRGENNIMASDNLSAVQPSANPAPTTSASDPAKDVTPSVTDLGVNEAVALNSFPNGIGSGSDASMTISQPAGGPIVTTEAGPN